MDVDPPWMVSSNQFLIVRPVSLHGIRVVFHFPIRARAHPKHAINAPLATQRGCAESHYPFLDGSMPTLYESLVLSSAPLLLRFLARLSLPFRDICLPFARPRKEQRAT